LLGSRLACLDNQLDKAASRAASIFRESIRVYPLYDRFWRILLQKSQMAQRLIFRQRTNKRQSPINRASNALPESPVSLALGDVVPHIIIQLLHLRVGEFESHLAKRLLQQYRRKADVHSQTERLSS
jgi:hypothetical protein